MTTPGAWGSEWNDDDTPNPLIGRRVTAIWLGEHRLTFETDAGLVGFEVKGDCCSYSYFHDVVGVEHLLGNGVVTGFESVDLAPGDVGYHDPDCRGAWSDPAPCGVDHDSLQVYGYRITTEHPKWGPVSTVVAFRNDSNGYYGGWMEQTVEPTVEGLSLITADVIGFTPAGAS